MRSKHVLGETNRIDSGKRELIDDDMELCAEKSDARLFSTPWADNLDFNEHAVPS